jgi:hypothetical protein
VYFDWGINLMVVGATALVVAVCVLLHYEGLLWLAARLKHLGGRRRRRVLVGVYALLGLHVIEIWLFGLVLYALSYVPGAGGVMHLDGSAVSGLLDSIYLSATSYTTVGFGDLAPIGPLRFLVGTESLAGLLLITWSASFTYLEMATYWKDR